MFMQDSDLVSVACQSVRLSFGHLGFLALGFVSPRPQTLI